MTSQAHGRPATLARPRFLHPAALTGPSLPPPLPSYRDLLTLDPAIPIPFPSAILIREHALIVSLEARAAV